jgi:hypothetical protein
MKNVDDWTIERLEDIREVYLKRIDFKNNPDSEYWCMSEYHQMLFDDRIEQCVKDAVNLGFDRTWLRNLEG